MQWRVSLHHYSNNQACQTFTEEVLLCFKKASMLYIWGQALALELVLMWLLKPCLMKMLWSVCSSCIPNRFTLGHCSCWDPTNTGHNTEIILKVFLKKSKTKEALTKLERPQHPPQGMPRQCSGTSLAEPTPAVFSPCQGQYLLVIPDWE